MEFKTRYLPGQTPYTEAELKALGLLINGACAAEDTIPQTEIEDSAKIFDRAVTVLKTRGFKVSITGCGKIYAIWQEPDGFWRDELAFSPGNTIEDLLFWIEDFDGMKLN